ncbi:MAG: Asp-tRNA(Asn)/Glu-tRNA(Gln) amidotransferase subunit GatC [Spirochaetales bacterium]|nr:Asp-tRNA(Asn)/Glu-tRNA(Gln) amidotransferase subunit GatC [Spirochaetales bacterium]
MIDDKTLQSILFLSRLDVSDEEKEHFRKQVGDILDYVAQLQDYETEGIDPDLGKAVTVDRLRADKARPGFTHDDVARFGAHFSDGFFVVPRIIEDFLENRDEE